MNNTIPKTLGRVVTTKGIDSTADWVPKETLETMIELIDIGDIIPTNIAIIYSEVRENADKEEVMNLNYFVSNTNKCDVLAMVTSLQQQLIQEWF